MKDMEMFKGEVDNCICENSGLKARLRFESSK